MSSKETALAVVATSAAAAGTVGLIDLDSAQRFAKAMFAAKVLVPNGANAERAIGEALVKMQAGAELSLSPMASLRGIHIIQGVPALSSGLVLAQMQRAGYRVEYPEHDDKACTVRITAPDGRALTPDARWTQEDAKRAGLTGKDNWKRWPRQMLRARAVAEAARMHAAEVFFGSVYTLADFGVEELPAKAEAKLVERELKPAQAAMVGEAPTPKQLARIASLIEDDRLPDKWRMRLQNSTEDMDREKANRLIYAAKKRIEEATGEPYEPPGEEPPEGEGLGDRPEGWEPEEMDGEGE